MHSQLACTTCIKQLEYGAFSVIILPRSCLNLAMHYYEQKQVYDWEGHVQAASSLFTAGHAGCMPLLHSVHPPEHPRRRGCMFCTQQPMQFAAC
jgi:hypothetical protein